MRGFRAAQAGASWRPAAIGARPIKGVLFPGAPGTGKTMLARIIASRSTAEFYEISGPQISSKWLGESDAILRVCLRTRRSRSGRLGDRLPATRECSCSRGSSTRLPLACAR